MIGGICSLLGVSCEKVLEESERSRALAWYYVNQIERSSGKPRGVKFFVDTFPSLEKAYYAFLSD